MSSSKRRGINSNSKSKSNNDGKGSQRRARKDEDTGKDVCKDVDLLEICSLAVDEALRLGASEVEAYASRSKHITAYIESNDLKHVKTNEPLGIGIRVILNGAVGFASINTLDVEKVKDAINTAMSIARACPSDKHQRLPSNRYRITRLNGIYDKGVDNLTVEDIARYANDMLNAARGYDPRVMVDSGLFESSSIEHCVRNSNGIEAWERISILTWSIMGMARDNGSSGSSGMVSNFDVQMGSSHSIKGIDTIATAEEFAKNVVGSLNSRKGENFKGTMIVTPNAFLELFKDPITFAINAFNVQRGASRFARMIGKRVAADVVTIIDDATYTEGIGASSFDREGVAHRRNVIVEKGILKTFIHNMYTASKSGIESTGNAAGSIASPPSIDTTNLIVDGGNVKYEDMIREVKYGIVINRFSGNVNAVDGIFSGVVKGGYMVIDGEVAYPVREIMVAGNIYDALKDISMVSKERRLVLDSLLPYIAVDNVSFTTG
ncbi:MAG: TldD/PmbA family protein [Candidatus Nitrosocaldus sp.]